MFGQLNNNYTKYDKQIPVNINPLFDYRQLFGISIAILLKYN